MHFQRWAALHVAMQRERSVSLFLAEKGYEVFLPTHPQRHAKGSKRRAADVPLFPGYVFCRQKEQSHGLLVTTPGVFRIISVGGTVVYLADDEINSIKMICRSGRDCGTHPHPHSGDVVKVISGPLCGITGIVVRTNNRHRIVVSLSMLMKSVFVEISESDVAVSKSTDHFLRVSAGQVT